MIKDHLHSPRSAASYFEKSGVATTVDTLRVQRSLGRGPNFVKVGGRVYYPEKELDKYLFGKKDHIGNHLLEPAFDKIKEEAGGP